MKKKEKLENKQINEINDNYLSKISGGENTCVPEQKALGRYLGTIIYKKGHTPVKVELSNYINEFTYSIPNEHLNHIYKKLNYGESVTIEYMDNKKHCIVHADIVENDSVEYSFIVYM